MELAACLRARALAGVRGACRHGCVLYVPLGVPPLERGLAMLYIGAGRGFDHVGSLKPCEFKLARILSPADLASTYMIFSCKIVSKRITAAPN